MACICFTSVSREDHINWCMSVSQFPAPVPVPRRSSCCTSVSGSLSGQREPLRLSLHVQLVDAGGSGTVGGRRPHEGRFPGATADPGVGQAVVAAAGAARVAVGVVVLGAQRQRRGHALISERDGRGSSGTAGSGPAFIPRRLATHGPGGAGPAGAGQPPAAEEDGGEHGPELAADGAVDEEVDAGVERDQQPVDVLEGDEERVGEDVQAAPHRDVERHEHAQRVAHHEHQHHRHHHAAHVQHVHARAAHAAPATTTSTTNTTTTTTTTIAGTCASLPQAQPGRLAPGLVSQHASAVRGEEVDEEAVEDDEGGDGQKGGEGDVGHVHGRVVGLVQTQLGRQQRSGAAQVRVGHVLEELGEVEEERGEEDGEDDPLGPHQREHQAGMHHEA